MKKQNIFERLADEPGMILLLTMVLLIIGLTVIVLTQTNNMIALCDEFGLEVSGPQKIQSNINEDYVYCEIGEARWINDEWVQNKCPVSLIRTGECG